MGRARSLRRNSKRGHRCRKGSQRPKKVGPARLFSEQLQQCFTNRQAPSDSTDPAAAGLSQPTADARKLRTLDGRNLMREPGLAVNSETAAMPALTTIYGALEPHAVYISS